MKLTNSYKITPFWFINHQLEKNEIKIQLRLMSECGVDGFFVHPRAGLKIPYLSEEWFEYMEFIIEEAEKLNLKVWLYDEDPFPSGAVGGKVFLEHPEFAARGLTFYEFEADSNGIADHEVGRGMIIEAVAVKLDAAGNVAECRDISNCIGVLRKEFFRSDWNSSYYAQIFGKKEFPHYRAETFYPVMQLHAKLPGPDWKIYVTSAEFTHYSKYNYLPDNLNSECVKYFMEHTHAEYETRFRNKFGTTIPGIFTDEPSVGSVTPWTGKLESTFETRHGRKLKDSYYHLFKNFGQTSRQLRNAYWETVYHLFAENYFKPISEWCTKNSLELCGHCIGEEDPLGTSGGSNTFGLQSYFQIPGFDHITNNIPNGGFKSLNLGGKLISSAALQQGKRRVLSECFGCNPFNFRTDGMKKVANWLFALGVNWLVPHGFFYSYDGYRKFDAGKSFFFQDPQFSEFNSFAAYAERLGRKLGEADSMNHVCILFPVSVFRSLLPAEHNAAEEVREELYHCVQHLLDRHIQFDLADETTLFSSKVTDGIVNCGHQQYDTIVTVKLQDELFQNIERQLDKFRHQGVKIVEYSFASPEINLAAEPLNIVKVEHDNSLCMAKTDSLMVTVKRISTGTMAYIFNNSEYPGVFKADFTHEFSGCCIYNAEDDSYAAIEPDDNGDFIFAINGFAASIIEFRNTPFVYPAYAIPETFSKTDYDYEKHPQWDYQPPGNNWLASINHWQIKVEGKFVNKTEPAQPFCLMRDFVGTELPHLRQLQIRPIFDLAPEIPSMYPVKAEFSSAFTLIADKLKSNLWLVFESETISGNAEIYINGQRIAPDAISRKRCYDPFNLAAKISAYCHAGQNTLTIKWKKADEFDGLKSSIYIMEE